MQSTVFKRAIFVQNQERNPGVSPNRLPIIQAGTHVAVQRRHDRSRTRAAYHSIIAVPPPNTSYPNKPFAP
jgi:hypothetical protein